MKRLKREEVEVYEPDYPVDPPSLAPTTAEGLENECISLAYGLARQHLQEGSATPSEIVHFLKLGTANARLELEKSKKELELMEAKKRALQSAEKIEELYTSAINAMKDYAYLGQEELPDDFH